MNSQQNSDGSSDMTKSIEIIKAIIASSAIFLPASLPHREVMTESAFSISQLVGFIFDSIHNGDKICSPFDSTPLLYLLRTISRSISYVEVALELVSRAIFGEKNRMRMVVTLEALKMMLRLCCLFGQSETYMILDWDRKAPSERSFRSYYDHYKTQYERILSRILTSPEFALSSSIVINADNNGKSTNSGPSIMGKRSGLKITLKSGLASMLNVEDTSITDQQTTMNLNARQPVVERRNVYLTHSARIPVDQLSPGSQMMNSIINLNDFNTPIKDDAVDMNRDEVSPSRFSENSGDVVTGITGGEQDEMDQKAQNLFLVAEVIYIVRPFTYALLQYGLINEDFGGIPEGALSQTVDMALPKLSMYSTLYRNVIQTAKLEVLKNVVPLVLGSVLEFVSIQMSLKALAIVQEQAKKNLFGQKVDKSQVGELSFNTLQMKFEGDILAYRRKAIITRHVFDEEIKRRKMMLYLCLLRSPLFDRATLPILKRFCAIFENIPLIGSIPHHGLALLVYLNKVHFYTSNS